MSGALNTDSGDLPKVGLGGPVRTPAGPRGTWNAKCRSVPTDGRESARCLVDDAGGVIHRSGRRPLRGTDPGSYGAVRENAWGAAVQEVCDHSNESAADPPIYGGLPGGILVPPSSPVLRPFVAAVGYLRSRATDARELFLPTGCVLLTVNLGEEESRWYDGVDFANPRRGASAMVVSAGVGAIGAELGHWSLTAGVAFRPGGAGPFLGLPVSAIDRPVVALENLWGRDGTVLRERLMTAETPPEILRTLETVLLERLSRPAELDLTVAHAASGLDGGLSVAHVVDRVGLSDRTFLRRFTDQVGISPKRFARVRRLQRVLAHTAGAAPVNWARLAADCGYFDQAHLINDFRRLTGVTPGAFRSELACPVNHLPISGGGFLQSPGARTVPRSR